MTQRSDVSSTLSIRGWMLVALYFLLLVSPGLAWLTTRPGLPGFVQGLVIPAALLAAYFACFGGNLWIGLLLLGPFVAIAPAEFAFVATYRHPSDYHIVGTLVESNPREVREYLGWTLWPMVAAFTCSTFVAALAPWLAFRHRFRWKGDSRIYVLLIAAGVPIAILVFATLQSRGPISKRMTDGLVATAGYLDNIAPSYPFGVPFRAYAYFKDWQQMRLQGENLQAFRFGATVPAQEDHRRQIYVFVVGESSRRDHWSLFGYERETNPELQAAKNLVPFPDVITPWPNSRLAVPMLLTRKPAGDPQLYFSEPSILRVYSEAGFHTYWLSNQLAVGPHDSSISTTAYEADHVRFFNPAGWSDAGTFDEVLLPALQETITHTSGNVFVVLHTMGSHENYAVRYPAAFDKFKPSLDAPGSAPYNQRLLNSYDNSILYTDHFLAAVIRILESSGGAAAMFYASDHGEDIPNEHCHLSGHGNLSRSNYIIPALFWYSNEYAAEFGNNVAQLRANSHRRLTTEDFFETLVDLGGIDFPSHNRTRSAFSDRLLDRTRLVNAFGNVDFDHAALGKDCQTILPQ
jgi:glucan phosphoethanolaminetransferase (alkaline phosphatase superfamily)